MSVAITSWSETRADALEVEADALMHGVETLQNIVGMLPAIESQGVNTAITILERTAIGKREAAGKLRATK